MTRKSEQELLKECPFCGCNKTVFVSDDGTKESLGYINCPSCFGRTGGDCQTYNQATEAWNHRPTPSTTNSSEMSLVELVGCIKELIESSKFMREEYSDMNDAVKKAEKALARAKGE